MHPWTRPTAHSTFAVTAKGLLDDVRKAVDARGGIPQGDDFKGRELWNGSWPQSKLPNGIHKQTLVGSDPEDAKCCWCEQRFRWKRSLDVEHYRPKAKVTRWDGNPPLVSDVPPKEIDVDTGYWWLGFSWDNFSLACAGCNQEFKRNLFPVIEPRDPCREGVEHTETPLLIDPASVFRVRDHFAWSEGGLIDGISDDGRATIITCGLNRKDLRSARAQVAENTLHELRAWKSAQQRGDKERRREAFARLAKLGDRQSEFTSMVRWFVEKYLGVVWDQLPGFPQ